MSVDKIGEGEGPGNVQAGGRRGFGSPFCFQGKGLQQGMRFFQRVAAV